MSGGKSQGGSKDYYGHCAGIICCGQLDFIWGFTVNNNLAWPIAKDWLSQLHQKNKIVLYLDGNVYQAGGRTDLDPPAAPWALFAIPYPGGTVLAGTKVLYLNNVWQANVNTSTAPPITIPIQAQPPRTLSELDTPASSGDWKFICTPAVFSPATHFWTANSIVAHNGRLWIANHDTNSEPGFSADWTLWKQDLTAQPNPFKFTVPNNSAGGGGDVYIYRGTGDQTLDTVNEQILNALGHPPYRYRAVVMLKNFFFGSSTTSPPNIAVLGGRSPVQSIVINNTANAGVDATAMDADWQVNPWCVLAELLTHPVYGLGLPNSMFDQASWQAEADRCAQNTELYYISPMYDSLKKVREIIADILGHIDSFIYWGAVATLIAGHWPHDEAAPAFTAATTIDRNDLIGEIESDSQGWGDTASAVSVTVQDIEAGFKSRPALAPNLFNRQVTRRLQTQKIDRPHIVRYDQGLQWATEAARIYGDQTFQCQQLTVRAEKATQIQPGTIFQLTDDAIGFSIPMRCTGKIVKSDKGEAVINCMVERGVSPLPYSPTSPTTAPASGPAPSRVTDFHLTQVPSQLSGAAQEVACLASRADTNTTGFELWFKSSDNSFQSLGKQIGFGISGLLNESINDPFGSQVGNFIIGPGDLDNPLSFFAVFADGWNSTLQYDNTGAGVSFTNAVYGTDYIYDPIAGTFTVLSTGSIIVGAYVTFTINNAIGVTFSANVPTNDIEDFSAPLTQDQINNSEFLLFMFQAANPKLYEIATVKQLQALSPSFTFIYARRAQFGTLIGGDGSYVFGPGDLFFIVRRDTLTSFGHQAFAGLAASAGTGDFIIAPQSAFVQAEDTDVYDPAANPSGLSTQFYYQFNDPFSPAVTWISQLVNNIAVDFTINHANTDIFDFTFNAQDYDNDMIAATLVAVQGTNELVLWSQTFQKTGNETRSMEFSIPNDGAWDLYLSVIDSAGNNSLTQLTAVGSTTPVQIYIVSGTAEPAPRINSKRITDGYVNGVIFVEKDTAASVSYQIQPLNTPYNPAGWSTPTAGGTISAGKLWGPLPSWPKKTKILYAKATRAGHLDSPIVSWKL